MKNIQITNGHLPRSHVVFFQPGGQSLRETIGQIITHSTIEAGVTGTLINVCKTKHTLIQI